MEEEGEEFTETTRPSGNGVCKKRLVSKRQVITELDPEPLTEPEQEVSSSCNEQEHRREIVSLDIPDFLLPDAPEDELGG